MRLAKDLLDELNAVDETPGIEAKRSREVGKSILESISAFANEPGLGGGHLLLGVSSHLNERGDRVYFVEGVDDPDKIQADIASLCASSFSSAVRPRMRVEILDGRPVVVVRVQEAPVEQKPIYLTATGLPRGAWRRIGSTDQRCTDEDIWVLRDGERPHRSDDAALVSDATLDDLDAEAIQEYRRLRQQVNPDAEELLLNDAGLLEAIGASRRDDGVNRPTLAGLMLFGKTTLLRRLFPAVRIDYMRFSDTDAQGDPVQVLDIRKPLLLAMRQAIAALVDDLPRGFRLSDRGLQSEQQPVVPLLVLREAMANAVMHRSYKVHQPIQVVRYSNRIAISNPGYSLKNPEDLGRPGSRQRNPFIAAVLHDLNLAETKGTGVARMRRLTKEAGLTPPEFDSDRSANRFDATLHLHHLLQPDDLEWLRGLTSRRLSDDEGKALIYARETGAIDNTACRELTGLDTLSASVLLRGLRDMGLLVKHGSGSQTHYALAEEVTKLDPEVTEHEAEVSKLGHDSTSLKPDEPSDEPSSVEPNEDMHLPEALRARALAAHGRHLKSRELRSLISDLCAHGPKSAEELAGLVGKTRSYLLHHHVRPMIATGILNYQYPESPKHPQQRYRVPNED